MNKITLIGNLTKDPESRTTPTGHTVCSFTIAVNRKFTSGERQADFFRINAWRQLGENCMKYLAKGRKVAVVGELQARIYDAKDGQQRLSLDVQADEVEFLSPKEDAPKKEESPRPAAKQKGDPALDDWMSNVNMSDLPWEQK